MVTRLVLEGMLELLDHRLCEQDYCIGKAAKLPGSASCHKGDVSILPSPTTSSSLPQDSDSLHLISLYSRAPPTMQVLDSFLREDLFYFVETAIHSVDTPVSSPAPNAASSETAPDSVGLPNTVYLAQKFIGKVAAFGPHAPYPDDLHARFRHGLTHFPEAARLTDEQLKAFDNDYSSVTRERAVILCITQQSAALFDLMGVRNKLREAEAQHELQANNRSTSQLTAARKEFERKCAQAMSSTKLLVRCVEELQNVLTHGVYWGSEAEPPLLDVPELAEIIRL